MSGQFVARIKQRSRYAHQAPKGKWFPITFEYRFDKYCVVGNLNHYTFADVVIGVRLADGQVTVMKP